MSTVLLPLSLTLGPPLLVAFLVGVGRVPSRLDWLLSALLCAGVALHAHVAGPIWAWIGFGWRWLPLGAAVAAMLWSARQASPRPILPPRTRRRFAHTTVRGAVVVVLGVSLLHLHLARTAPAGAVDLAFPLEQGRYVVLQGGASRVLNHHRAVPAQAHAVDLVALNRHGQRARGVRPERLEAYEIFDRAVLAPCDGTVMGASDGTPDTPIGEKHQGGPAGNHVLLSCAVEGREITVLLAHLRAGSVTVGVGGEVGRGAPLGRVGSSGRSTEPHLHVHAVRGRGRSLDTVIAGGEAIPLTFEGRGLARNVVIEVPEEMNLSGRPGPGTHTSCRRASSASAPSRSISFS